MSTKDIAKQIDEIRNRQSERRDALKTREEKENAKPEGQARRYDTVAIIEGEDDTEVRN